MLAPRGAQTVTTFDGFGNRLSEVDPEGKTTTSRYEHGNMVEQIVTGQGVSIRTSATYELTFNKPVSITDANQQTTQITVDGRGNITRVQLPTGRAVITDYKANGDLERSVDQYGFVTTYENYDSHGNAQTIRRQTSGGNFVNTQQTFDARSRLKTTSGDLVPTVSNSYDASGPSDSTDRDRSVRVPRHAELYDDLPHGRTSKIRHAYREMVNKSPSSMSMTH